MSYSCCLPIASCLRHFAYNFNRNTFPIPEIIFDPTLVLSPHVFLLGILFRINAFKRLSKDGPVMNSPKKLYSLRELKLKDEILDRYIFYYILRKPDGIRIALEKNLNKGWLSYRIKRGGEITGFKEVVKPYYLRYGVAKAFNDSRE
ncbi:hypothetical protein N7486_002681 [Penicillium sp. IBT 16267x]|nr:hypothetical protein N7486_002681 [Penicillium sp. IBT 16267x]